MDLNELRLAVIKIAKQAAADILTIYDSEELGVVSKADDSPLTKADLASHHAIQQGLEQLTPDIPILSEESADIPFETRQTWRRYWLVDPLDGTKEFIKRNGEFTVNIALIEDGVPVLGVVQVPVTSVCYSGISGRSAYKEENGVEAPIEVAASAHKPLRAVGSRSHAGDRLKAYIENLGDVEMVALGSSLKMCIVAEGKADIYPRLGLTSEWDTAAAHAVVVAAGGQLTQTDLQPLRYNTKAEYLNPEFFVFGDASVDWSGFLP